MEETSTSFLFQKLRHNLYALIDVMMYVDLKNALEFMHCVNKEARTFLRQNYDSIKNGFINEGLIVYDIDGDKFSSY
jgi:hypothetical protein